MGNALWASKLDGKMSDYQNSAFIIRKLYGYEDGIEDARVVNTGFIIAKNKLFNDINGAERFKNR